MISFILPQIHKKSTANLINVNGGAGFVVIIHAHNKSDGYKICQKRRAAVGDERERNTCYWHKSDAHSDVLENMEQEHRADACAYIASESVIRALRGLKALINQHKQRHDKHGRADKSPFLRKRAENKVGIFRGQKSHLILYSV